MKADYTKMNIGELRRLARKCNVMDGLEIATASKLELISVLAGSKQQMENKETIKMKHYTNEDVLHGNDISAIYDEARIARELRITASGQSYYGNALYVALDIPCIMASLEHKIAIQRYLRGTQSATDHIRLQEAAIMIAPNK